MAELEGRITGDPSGFIKASKKAQGSLGKLSKRGDSTGKKLSRSFAKARQALNATAKAAAAAALKFGAVAAAASAAAITAGAIKSINLAREQIRVEKQLAAVLKSTAGAAGFSAEEIKRHASALQAVTNYGDEAIIPAQSLLLTFTQIGKDVFPQATETILDMSSALGQGLKESAVQVGKALNDPIKGVTALQRVGVAFTKQQKAVITSLVETGQVAAAQKIILKELATEFGGSARAQVDPLKQLQNVIGDVGEEIGKVLLPAVNALAKAAIPIFKNTASEFAALAKIIGRRSGAISKALDGIGKAAKTNQGLLSLALDAIAAGIRKVSKPLAGLITGFEVMFKTAKLAVTGLQLIKATAEATAKAIAAALPGATDEVKRSAQEAELALAELAREAEGLRDALTEEGIARRYDELKRAIGGAAEEVTKLSKEIQEENKLEEDRLKTTTRQNAELQKQIKLKTQLRDKPKRGGGRRHQRSGGASGGFLQLGIVRGQRGAGFPGLQGAGGQFGTVGATAGQGGPTTGPFATGGGGAAGGGGAGPAGAFASLAGLFQKFKALADQTANKDLRGFFDKVRGEFKDLAKTIGTPTFGPELQRLQQELALKMSELFQGDFTNVVIQTQDKIKALADAAGEQGLGRAFERIEERLKKIGDTTGPAAEEAMKRLASDMDKLAEKAKDPAGTEFKKLADELRDTARVAGEAGLREELEKTAKALENLKDSAAKTAKGISAAAQATAGSNGRHFTGRRTITGRRVYSDGAIESRQGGGFLTKTGKFAGHSGEFVIQRRAAQTLGPNFLRMLNSARPVNVHNTINASDRSVLGSKEQIRAMLPELRRQTKLGVRQGGPF